MSISYNRIFPTTEYFLQQNITIKTFVLLLYQQ